MQLIGGIVLHSGKIAEMKTGEGKTLVATLPCYLNALAGRGVHVVTVNDYLAKRDAEWMGKIYGFLGLSVGVIVHDLSDEQRREAYGSDITYGTNNEFGFDYLRDNMKFEMKDQVQRGNYYCIVDEVDSILIDEARTPLIISGPTDQTTDKYARVNVIIPKLEQGELIETLESKTWTGDFVIDEKARAITVTDEGWEKIEELLGIGNIADPENWDLKHHVEVAIKAHNLYKRDVEYVVKDGEVIIVDEFTGRLMPGRRWSDGLHQAVEAKEGVNIRKEDQTLATITFQNYFRMYKKLSGMTGTAETEAAEFDKIYKLEIVVIPTNRKLLRIENQDVVFRTAKEKYFAVADEITRLHEAKPARAGRHHQHREVRVALRDTQAQGRPPRRPQREVPREGGRDRRAGRPSWHGDHRHQHGRSRHRHSARRQLRLHGTPGPRPKTAGARRLRRRGRDLTRRRPRHVPLLLPVAGVRDHAGGLGRSRRRARCSSWRLSTTPSSPPAACTFSAPSATSRAAWTTSSADAQDARATPARRASISPSKTT